jgi:hypothetical protein
MQGLVSNSYGNIRVIPGTHRIPPLLKNNNLIFNDLDKANEFNNFFAMQTDLDDSEAILPELSLLENQLCDIEISIKNYEHTYKRSAPYI